MGEKRQSGKKDVEEALKKVAERQGRPTPVASDRIEHPGDECPCDECN